MVSNLSPCSTPSQVWMVLLDLTGMVPSPDSILVLNCPRAFRLGCLSPWSERPWEEGNKKQTNTNTLNCIRNQTDWFITLFYIQEKCWIPIRGQHEKTEKKKHDLLFIIMLSMFSAVPPAGAIYSVTNWMWLFSIQSAMCNGKHFDKSKREVNQTDNVGGLGGRKTDRDRQRMTKSSNY